MMSSIPLDPELLKLLRCPLSHKPLVQDGASLISTDPATRRRYAIVDGIPDMLVDDAVELSELEWREIMARADS